MSECFSKNDHEVELLNQRILNLRHTALSSGNVN